MEVTVGIDIAQVTDGNEPIHLIERNLRVGIANEGGRIGQVNFAHFTAGNLVAVLIEDAQFGAGGNLAANGGVFGHLLHAGG